MALPTPKRPSNESLVPHFLDPETAALYLEIPGSRVVLLQAYFETAEGIGIVRTLDIKRSLVTVLTTTSMLETCQSLLFAVWDRLHWQAAAPPPPKLQEHYLGYFRK